MSDRRTNVDKSLALLTAELGQRTLEDLRKEAAGEPTSVRYQSVRVDHGPRLVMIVCVTGASQIATLRRAFDFGDLGPGEDWAALTLLDVALRVMRGNGLGFEVLKTATGDWSALALIAANPRSITILETAFGLRP